MSRIRDIQDIQSPEGANVCAIVGNSGLWRKSKSSDKTSVGVTSGQFRSSRVADVQNFEPARSSTDVGMLARENDRSAIIGNGDVSDPLWLCRIGGVKDGKARWGDGVSVCAGKGNGPASDRVRDGRRIGQI